MANPVDTVLLLKGGIPRDFGRRSMNAGYVVLDVKGGAERRGRLRWVAANVWLANALVVCPFLLFFSLFVCFNKGRKRKDLELRVFTWQRRIEWNQVNVKKEEELIDPAGDVPATCARALLKLHGDLALPRKTRMYFISGHVTIHCPFLIWWY